MGRWDNERASLAWRFRIGGGIVRLKNQMAACVALTLAMGVGRLFAQGQSETPPKPAENCAELPKVMAKVEAQSRTLLDWPNLARYREANASLTAPAKDEQRVVFMGDSITDMWALPRFGGFFPGKPYINRGISGQTTPQMLVRFRPDAIALQPKVVVILAGTNDLAGNTGPMTVESIEDNLRSMAELAMLNGIRVVFASVLPINDYTKNKDGAPVIQSARRPPDKIIAINQWMKTFAEQNNQTYLDYFSAVVDDKGFLKEDLS